MSCPGSCTTPCGASKNERCAITLEDLDPDLAAGFEFTFVDKRGAVVVTQVKRPHSINDHWTVAALRRLQRPTASCDGGDKFVRLPPELCRELGAYTAFSHSTNAAGSVEL